MSQIELYRVQADPSREPDYQIRHEANDLGPPIRYENIAQLIGAWLHEADIPTKLSKLAGYEALDQIAQAEFRGADLGQKGLPYFEKWWTYFSGLPPIRRLGWMTAALPQLLQLVRQKEARNRRLKDLLTKSQASNYRLVERLELQERQLGSEIRRLDQAHATARAELATYKALVAQAASSRCEDLSCPCDDHELDLTDGPTT